MVIKQVEPIPPEEGKIWYCRVCMTCAKIYLWTEPTSLQVEKELEIPGLGTHYKCLTCGVMGRMSDGDAPIQITEEQDDKYWRELQTNSKFVPPKESE